jgi:hypothetical protein
MENRGKWVSVNGAVELPFPSEYLEVKAAFIGRKDGIVKSIGCRIYYVKQDRFRASRDHKFVIDAEQDVYVRSQGL